MSARTFCLLCLLLCLLFARLIMADSAQPETAIMQVVINTEDKGEQILLLTAEDALLPAEILPELGFKTGLKLIELEGKKYLSLHSLKPKVNYEIQKGSILVITADPVLFQQKEVDLNYSRQLQAIQTQNNSAFLNYNFSYGQRDQSAFSSTYELGASIHRILGLTSFSYQNTNEANRLLRLNTSITSDSVQHHTRLIVGDFSAFTGELGSGGSFGGVSYSSNYSTTPYFVTTTGLDLKGTLQTPSDVEVYVNGLLVSKQHLGPGEFQFSNLRNVTGAGEATILIRDAFGREERIFVPFYLSSTLLKQGLHDFSYNIGFRREQSGNKSFDYDELSVLGFHRYGFSNTLTGGFRFEASKDLVNLGPTATFLLGHMGQITTSIAGSHGLSKTGYAGMVDYLYLTRQFGFQVSGRKFSDDYANLNSDGAQRKPRLHLLGSFNFRPRAIGSVSLSLSRQENYSSVPINTATITYSRPLFRSASLQVSISRNKEVQTDNRFFASVNFLAGSNRSANLTYRKQDSQESLSGTLVQNPPRGTGFGYRLAAQTEDSQQDMQTQGDAFLQYKGAYGIYSAQYFRNNGDSYDLRLAGGISLISSRLYFSRPITDSFALVQLGDVTGINVLNSNAVVARTNSKGEALVPDLVSYLDNNLSIAVEKIPANYKITKTQEYLNTPLRGGGILKFDVTKTQGIDGHLFVVTNGKRKPVEYLPLEIILGKKIIETVLGKNGEFYIENIPVGVYPAKAITEEGICHFMISVPRSQDVVLDLGELTCELR